MASKVGDSEKDAVQLVCFGEESAARVELSRPVFTNRRTRPETSRGPVEVIKRKIRTIAAKRCTKQAAISFLPVITWISKYNWKTQLLADVLAGLTVGIMSIPQGMAYARLAGMPPVYGLYTNIIPTAVYFLLGTAKIAAIGPSTVLCLITASIRYKYIPCQDCWRYKYNSTVFNMDNSTGLDSYDHQDLTPIDVGTAVAFMVGMFLILMGLLRLTFISSYLPDQLVAGFSTAAAVQVLAGQLPSMFGIILPHRDGVGKVVMNFIDLFSSITHTNTATFIIFSISLSFLIFCKIVITPRFQPKFKVPFPAEFVVMATATIASHFGHFHLHYAVSTVRYIPAGLPVPRLPRMSLLSSLAPETFLLAVVTYSHSISLAKLYANRNGYRVQAAQEFYAYGFMNLIGSFFQCINAGQSVARSLVYEAAGATSQLCGLAGVSVVLFTVLFIAPFLASLPNAALAAIIVTACLELLRNVTGIPTLFRKCKFDFAIYVVTLTSVVLLDVTIGLAVSVGFGILTVIIRMQRPTVEWCDVESVLLCSSDSLQESTQLGLDDRVMVLRLTTALFYANADKVTQLILDKVGRVDPDGTQVQSYKNKHSNGKPAIVILDMASVTFTDLMGIKAMKQILNKMKGDGIAIYLCGYTSNVEKLMSRTDLLSNPDILLFPTILDGISYAAFRLRNSGDPAEMVSNEEFCKNSVV